MNKEAIAAKALLGILGGGVALAGGGAAVGHRFGTKAGAERMGNKMAIAFSEANTKENKSIVDSFKAFNKKENTVLANQYLRRGVALGYNMASAEPSASTPMKKTASDIANEAFLDEIEKLGYPIKSLAALGMKGLKTLRGQFSGLGKGLKAAGSSAIAGIKVPAGMRSTHFGLAGSRVMGAAKANPYAAGLVGGVGLAGGGYSAGKSRTKRTIVDYRY